MYYFPGGFEGFSADRNRARPLESRKTWLELLAHNAGHKRINADAPLNLGHPSAAAMRRVPEIQGAVGVYAFFERHGCIEIQRAAAVDAFM